MDTQILQKVNQEKYLKYNDIKFTSIPEFLKAETWHWDNAGGDDENTIENFWQHLEVNFDLTEQETDYLQKILIETNF